MSVAPLFEWLAVLAISAICFAAGTQNFAVEHDRATVQNIITQMLALPPHVSDYCHEHNDDCTGVSIAALVAGGYLDSSVGTLDTNTGLRVAVGASSSDFVIDMQGKYGRIPLQYLPSYAPQVGDTSTGGYLQYCTRYEGLVITGTANACN